MNAFIIPDAPEWQDRAACAGNDVDLFVSESTGSHYRYARTVCADCPVKAECLDYGLHEEYGMWGGLGPRQRRRVRNERGITTAFR
jgi:WhiB family transcriptional regulator, redox-sensing transcriptional regulator